MFTKSTAKRKHQQQRTTRFSVHGSAILVLQIPCKTCWGLELLFLLLSMFCLDGLWEFRVCEISGIKLGLFIYFNFQWINCISVWLLYQNIWEDLGLFLKSKLSLKCFCHTKLREKVCPGKLYFLSSHFKTNKGNEVLQELPFTSSNWPVPAFQLITYSTQWCNSIPQRAWTSRLDDYPNLVDLKSSLLSVSGGV